METHNKYALVTGGSRGIGRAICIQLARQGYHILINFNSNITAAEKTGEMVAETGMNYELLQFDVADRDSTFTTINKWLEDNPDRTIDILVNNAGIKRDNLMIWMKDIEWDEVINTSLGGFYNVTKSVLPGMIKEKRGNIVNIVSLSGLKGLPGQTNYSASKAAVIGATKALATEVVRRNIRVNAVAPGFIETDMTEALDAQELKKQIPMRRFGTSKEVANVVGFLASDESSYITGETISVNGGLF